MRINELILYRDFKHEDILTGMVGLFELAEKFKTGKDINADDKERANIADGVNDEADAGIKKEFEEAQSTVYTMANRLIELASSHGYKGNLWQAFLTYLIANNENAYSTACEIRGEVFGTINDVALHDFEIFKELFECDIALLDKVFKTSCMSFAADYTSADEKSKLFNKRIRDRIIELKGQLCAAKSPEEFKERVTQFYGEFGVGKFGLHKAFRIEHTDSGVEILPITNIMHVYLEDLVGYESAKKKLTDNTEAFLKGKPCNNCLLFGDAGTGKSSSIKGILNRYYEDGLRIIEVYKHQFKDLNEVIAQIKNRNYRFIIYMDDLSFEDFEIEYKYLKAVIEGGLEKKPDNILIYATSNRRHLVREKMSDKADRDDELHTSDTVAEKLSLAARFGVSIFFCRPDKKEFNNIVKSLATRYNITMDEDELLSEANKWELSHGGLSGRCAQQFIDYIRGSYYGS